MTPFSTYRRDGLEQDSVPVTWSKSSTFAPEYEIPGVTLVGIDHPCIIRNHDRGIRSLGGLREVAKLATRTEKNAKLCLRPENTEGSRIKSARIQTNNVALKFTVPKRTGLKRKRGSYGPFERSDAHAPTSVDQSTPSASRPQVVQGLTKPKVLLRSLQDNSDNYQIEMMGHVEETHRFRDMPDFVFSTTESSFMSRMKDTIMSLDYTKMKDFKLNMSKGPETTSEVIPPPWLSTMDTPFNYAYLENPYVTTTNDPVGQTTSRNRSLPTKQHNQHTPLNAPLVPQGPSPHITPLESHEPAMRRLIIAARELFTKRPIYTRRALFNNLSRPDLLKIGSNATKHIQQYVGYMFDGGPWGLSIIRFGVDPRRDSKYRIYQTIMFQIETEPAGRQADQSESQTRSNTEIARNMGEQADSHMFGGKKVYAEGKVWQLCDVTDPLLAQLIATTELRDRCHLWYDGWYHNAWLAKIKTIMRQKILTIRKGESVDDAIFKGLVELPQVYNASTAKHFKLGRMRKDCVDLERTKWMDQIRVTAGRAAQKSDVGELDESEEAAWRHRGPQENEDVDEVQDVHRDMQRAMQSFGVSSGQYDEGDLASDEEPEVEAGNPSFDQSQADPALAEHSVEDPESMDTSSAQLVQLEADDRGGEIEMD